MGQIAKLFNLGGMKPVLNLRRLTNYLDITAQIKALLSWMNENHIGK